MKKFIIDFLLWFGGVITAVPKKMMKKSYSDLLDLLIQEAGDSQTSLSSQLVADVLYNEGLEDTYMYENAVSREKHWRSRGR